MMQEAARPFQFITAAKIIQICGQKATTLNELHYWLKRVGDGSIFYHTFQSLEWFHFLTEGFTNDFAQWVLAACNENSLAEQLAAVDVRDYVSLAELRTRLLEVVGDYLRENPAGSDRPGFEPFYFCESLTVKVSTGLRARTLREFIASLESIGLSSVYYHFLTSRLRLQLVTNDFSLWVRTCLDLPELAEQIERIDIYTNTLQGVRRKIIGLAEPWLEK